MLAFFVPAGNRLILNLYPKFYTTLYIQIRIIFALLIKQSNLKKQSQKITDLDPRKFIIIKGAKTHNLKDVDVAIPRNKLVVVTGVSGSGKSSLTIDTLYAEGQRRYVESLSSYARQFLNRMQKPDVEYIKGICPAIAIEQKVATRSSRSTVGTLTEVFDYLRLLFARVGKTISPISGNPVKKESVSDVVDYIFDQKEGSKIQILIPLNVNEERSVQEELLILLQKGYTRIFRKKEVHYIEDFDASKIKKAKDLFVLIDRVVVKSKVTEDLRNRVADSVLTAFNESNGDCIIDIVDGKRKSFSNRFELDGMRFEIPSPQFFNFNNPYGACKRCEGFGSVVDIDEKLVIPDWNKSVFDGAIVPWRGEKMSRWLNAFTSVASKFDFPIHRPIKELTEVQRNLLWTGNDLFNGLNAFFKHLGEQKYKIHYRIMLSRYRGKTVCPDCNGTRLRKDTQYVTINGKSIKDIVLNPISDIIDFFEKPKLNKQEKVIAKRILIEVQSRLKFMMDVGLGYLTLNRLSSTLSGGETQRINLTRSLGSNLTSSMYILDEPSIGLHPRDTQRLISVLQSLRNLGNTVIVVEHEEEIIKAADHIIDIGPFAGRLGGELIFNGDAKTILKDKNSLTGRYLTGKEKIPVPKHRRKIINTIEIIGAFQHNLKNISTTIPLNAITAVTGVSGSGKSTLIRNILYPALKRQVEDKPLPLGNFEKLNGDLKTLAQVEFVDQNPLGRSSRSNPVTYVKAYDGIRKLFADHKLSKARKYTPGYFSFNIEGGRCEKCKGDGQIVVEMQFLADVRLICDECNGKRFKSEIMDIKIQNKTIADILDLTVDESLEFFAKNKSILKPLQALADVGLGYIKLGQSSSTLSGGEAQRVKLAFFLSKGSNSGNIFFIFDEPTTGLHFNDINKLMKAMNALVDNGHTVLIIEHNIDVIKCTDWVIDLGPEGGIDGGQLLFQGTPEELVKTKGSYTAKYLKEKLKN